MTFPVHTSETGSFQELLHASDIDLGNWQMSLLTVAPWCKRGGHYHTRKKEWFCCLHGKCYIVTTDTRTRRQKGIWLDDNDKRFIVVNPGEAHIVMNPGDTECELLVVCSEEYDPENPDTITCREYPKECEVHGVENCLSCGVPN